jgi:hypothetical protein
MTEGPRVAKARYLYAIASTREKQSIGNIGIDESAVYTIPFKSISAVVHSCEPSHTRRGTEHWQRAGSWSTAT